MFLTSVWATFTWSTKFLGYSQWIFFSPKFLGDLQWIFFLNWQWIKKKKKKLRYPLGAGQTDGLTKKTTTKKEEKKAGHSLPVMFFVEALPCQDMFSSFV